MAAFEKICKDNYSRIFKYILGMTGSRECAWDLTPIRESIYLPREILIS